MIVWVDADSCPKILREFLVKKASVQNFCVTFVANSEVQKQVKNVKMQICEKKSGAADDFLVEKAQKNDIVITRDIPLAARLVEKNICVMNDRGILFSKDNIKERLQERELNLNLSNLGFFADKKSFYSEKELKKFETTFEYVLGRRIFL